MSYEPNVWAKGDVVTSAKLNNMEQGIAAAGGVFVVHSNYDDSTNVSTLDKTWNEINDAGIAGQVPIIIEISETGLETPSHIPTYVMQLSRTDCFENADYEMEYTVTFIGSDYREEYEEVTWGASIYKTSSADGYPDDSWMLDNDEA